MKRDVTGSSGIHRGLTRLALANFQSNFEVESSATWLTCPESTAVAAPSRLGGIPQGLLGLRRGKGMVLIGSVFEFRSASSSGPSSPAVSFLRTAPSKDFNPPISSIN